ncbi:MAG: GldG family protein [Chloroflexia bacterium]
MTTDNTPDTPLDAPEQPSANRILLASLAGWAGLVLLAAYLLYWAVTGNWFDLVAKILLIVTLLALGAFGLMNPQGIIDLVTGRGTRSILSTVLLLALGIGIIAAVNILYGEIGKRQPAAVLSADLTEGKQNSLSPQSIKAAQELKSQTNVYEFFTQRTADDLTQQRTADNLVKQYQKYTDKLTIHVVNPDADPATASQYGLTKANVVVFDNGTHRETAPTNDETGFTGSLLRLYNNVKKTVAFLNVPSLLSLGGSAAPQAVPASVLSSGLQQDDYTVLAPYNLVVSPTISPKDVDVMIVPPAPTGQTLSDTAVRALSDYLDKGGHVLLIGDPLAAPLPAALLQKYGLSEARGVIVENNQQNIWGQSQAQLLYQTYPANTITTSMNNVPTAFRVVEPIVVATTTVAGFTTSPIIQSNADAAYGVIQTSGGQAQLVPQPNGPKGPYNIGVSVEQTITATNNFTDTNAPKPTQTRLVVFGDYDFLGDDLTSQQGNGLGNLDLFKNTVNWLSQSEERISIRPKDTTTRSIVLSAESQNLISWSTIVVLPALILLGGGIVWWRRR